MSSKPFRIWKTDRHLNHGGVVSPQYLQFDSQAEAETVAARYRTKFPMDLFTVIELDERGYKIP